MCEQLHAPAIFTPWINNLHHWRGSRLFWSRRICI